MKLDHEFITEDILNRPIYLDEYDDLLGIDLDNFDPASEETAVAMTRLALEIEKYGQNSKYPVGVAMWGKDKDNRIFMIPAVNTIPQKIKDHLAAKNGEPENIRIPSKEEIAGSHMSAHGEFMGLLAVPFGFQSLYVATSRAFCATCGEALCELGNSNHHRGNIEMLYSASGALHDKGHEHHKEAVKKWGFAKPILRNVFGKGKVGMALIDTKAGKIVEHIAPFVPKRERGVYSENPVEIEELEGITSFDQIDMTKILKLTKQHAKSSKTPRKVEAVTLIQQDPLNGKFYRITASASLPPGFRMSESKKFFEHDEHTEKRSYLYLMDALKRSKIAAIDMGLNTHGAKAVCTRIPTSGMLVNAVEYGITDFYTDKSLTVKWDRPELKEKFKVFYKFIKKSIINRIEVEPLQNGNNHERDARKNMNDDSPHLPEAM